LLAAFAYPVLFNVIVIYVRAVVPTIATEKVDPTAKSAVTTIAKANKGLMSGKLPQHTQA